ncbi:type II toxin-antitoxin system RelE family toxin [Mucilaginibacter phyllosphaerae]|uniref:Type II toxin-antitoxin system RelE/ParE family toxin n=1 Tax=Mucilaginibacter phyllosphaerae TaxID=1812349 RepID=A0A4Y8AK78_9SPHI|nr:type II toxin-antitoxin system RelE/ParE family toxin [Mucilaginibacter phyllosphaerae]MBB3967509.1 mRNA-degrading endonuclease RelE of RelBE toxin-antitoxin system [Mucilaginibacter phyllosphaerae]TEW69426.1 type II toxin-antitoxin system RelE/ParE family toxin [Mucilaginibacter phyllosphaerae]GGH21121.1 toxin RelE [Mucilaginibacter phyllosphaerae]
MQIEIRSSFTKDVKKLSDDLKGKIESAILMMINSQGLTDISNVKPLKGGKSAHNAYRMRIGDYRICFYLENHTIELVRVLPRKDVYKLFP